MKVLFVISSLNAGGAERVTVNLANYWGERKNWDVTIVTLSDTGSDSYRLASSVKRIRLDPPTESKNIFHTLIIVLQQILAIRRVILGEKPDITLGIINMANIYLACATIGIRGLVTIGSERNYPPMKPLKKIWQKMRYWTYGRLSAIVAMTEKTAQWLAIHTRSRRIVTIPNSVIYPLPGGNMPIALDALPGDSKILLAVGNYEKVKIAQKGLDLLIPLFAECISDFPDWHLVILGGGKEQDILEKMISDHNVIDRVLLPGKADNMAQWYKDASIFVLSSRYEGIPNVLLEAMAHGAPVVSFDCDTGPADIIRHEYDGLLVPANDTQAMKQSLMRLMADPDLRHRLGKRAPEVRERFSIEQISKQWEDLFNELRS